MSKTKRGLPWNGEGPAQWIAETGVYTVTVRYNGEKTRQKSDRVDALQTALALSPDEWVEWVQND